LNDVVVEAILNDSIQGQRYEIVVDRQCFTLSKHSFLYTGPFQVTPGNIFYSNKQ